jgi:ATP-dependent protease ClpP protease subunit
VHAAVTITNQRNEEREIKMPKKGRLPISGHIARGHDEAFDDALRHLVNNDCDELVLDIDSPGGDLNVAARIVKSILASGLPTTAILEYCASAASYIACAVDQTFARPGARLLLHNVSLSASTHRNAAALDRMADLARSTDDLIVAVYCRKTGLSAARVRALMARGEQGEVLELDEAIELGFVDGVLEWDVLDPPTPIEREEAADEESAVSEPSRPRPRASAAPVRRLDYAALAFASDKAAKGLTGWLAVAAQTQQILAAARAAGLLR